jgi:HAD superfamily PSPase-like hydrolase
MPMSTVCKCVVFDCDGVLVDSVSSWKTLHDGFGTDNSTNLSRFIAGELTDVEFMRSDIAMWKAIQDPIHKDDLFRMYSGVSLMKGARETVQILQDAGVYVAIVSAGVDLFVSSIAAMLKVDDWIANGFEFDKNGFLTDDGICRLHASGKGDVINRLMDMHGFRPEEVVSVGDSEMDLSMMVPGSGFIGFNPSRESSHSAFTEASVPIVKEKDLSKILEHIVLPSSKGN